KHTIDYWIPFENTRTRSCRRRGKRPGSIAGIAGGAGATGSGSRRTRANQPARMDKMANKKRRTETDWRVAGDFFDGCNCHFSCPCLFLEDPQAGDCEQAYAWHVEAGHYGDTPLDGFNVVATFYAPGNLVTGPRWTGALYLDERASPQQS